MVGGAFDITLKEKDVITYSSPIRCEWLKYILFKVNVYIFLHYVNLDNYLTLDIEI